MPEVRHTRAGTQSQAASFRACPVPTKLPALPTPAPASPRARFILERARCAPVSTFLNACQVRAPGESPAHGVPKPDLDTAMWVSVPGLLGPSLPKSGSFPLSHASHVAPLREAAGAQLRWALRQPEPSSLPLLLSGSQVDAEQEGGQEVGRLGRWHPSSRFGA